MKKAPKFVILFFLFGALVGALLMRVATPTASYRSVIASLHFLIREGDVASARAAFDSSVPYGGKTYLSRSQLTDLDRALHDATRKHVE